MTVGGRTGDRWDIDDAPPDKARPAPAGDVDRGELAGVDEDRAWARFTGVEGDDGQPTAAHRIEFDDIGDDPIESEARAPMGNGDDAGLGALYDQDESGGEPRSRSRFGRKR